MSGGGTWLSLRPSELARCPRRFSFSWPSPGEEAALRESIEQYSLLRPLLCTPLEGQATVVSGHRRLAAVEPLGKEVPCRLVEGWPLPDLWDLLLADHLDSRSLNPVELGLYLRLRIEDTDEEPEEVASRVLPRMGLPPRASAMEDPLWVAGLPPHHRDAFAAGWLPLQGIRPLRRADRGDALAILDLVSGMRVGVNKLSELATWILECSWRDGLAVEQWLEREGLAADGISAEGLRQRIRRLRYPQLAAWEQSFEGDVRRLHLPAGVGVTHPKGFEGGHLGCTVPFTSLPELEEILGRLLDDLRRGNLGPLTRYLG